MGSWLKKNEKQSVWIYMIAGGGYLLLLLARMQLMYVIHDDVYIRDIAAGVVSGTPDGHLIYMKYVLGSFLAALYRMIPNIDWYGAFLTGITVCSFLLVLYRCLEYGKRKLFILLGWMIGVACAGLYYLVLFQYTVTAGITGGTAVFLLFIYKKREKWRNVLELGVVGFLLVLTYLIRQETFLMVFPVFFVMLGWKMWEEKGKEYVVLLGIVLLTVAASFAVEKAAYSGEDWQEYLAYNKARTEVFDYYGVPPYAGNEAFYASIGMEEYEAVNLERYNNYLVDDLQGKKIEKIAAYAKEKYEEQNSLIAKAKACIKTVLFGLQEAENRPLNWLTLGMILLAFGVCIKNRSKQFWLCGLIVLLEAAFWLYLGWRGRFYWRVGACLFLVCFMAMGAVVLKELAECECGVRRAWNSFGRKWRAVLLTVIFVCGIGLSVKQYQKVESTSAAQYAKDQNLEQLRSYCAEHPENLYFSIVGILYPYSESFEWQRDFEVSNLMSLGDWIAYAPVTQEQLELFGVDDVRKALVQQENVYVILNNTSSTIENSCREFAEEIEWVEADTVWIPDAELKVYQLYAS